jgi:hypothetical protein
MSRLSKLDEENLAPDARAFLDALNSGPRGRIGLIGPFGVWAHAPKIGSCAGVRRRGALSDDAAGTHQGDRDLHGRRALQGEVRVRGARPDGDRGRRAGRSGGSDSARRRSRLCGSSRPREL